MEKENHIMKKGVMLMAAGLCMALAAGCAGPQGNDAGTPQPKEERVLTVGTDPAFPPFSYYQGQNRAYTGFDVELIDAVAKTAGYTRTEFVSADMKDLLDGLNAGRYDAVISCLSITDERKAQAAFTRPYAHSGYVAVTARGTTLSSPEDLANRKISVKAGSVAESMAHALSANVEPCATAEDALRHVVSGSSDVLLSDRYMAAYFAANGYGQDIAIQSGVDLKVPSDLAIAVRKEDAALLDVLNAGLATFMDTPEYSQLKKSYFGDYL